MLDYKEPPTGDSSCEVGDFRSFPSVMWPAPITKPDFGVWLRNSKRSAVRNAVCLFLIEAGLSVREVADFLGLSGSRTRTIARVTGARVFGSSGHGPLPITLSSDLRPAIEALNDRRQRERLSAAAYAVDRLANDYRSLSLVHSARVLLEQKGVDADALLGVGADNPTTPQR